MSILALIQQAGRFLRFLDNQWIVISDVEARQKIAHAIQYRIRDALSQSVSGVVAPDSPEPVSTIAIVPRKVTETKMLEQKEEHQFSKHFEKAFQSPDPMTMNQINTSDLCSLGLCSPGEQGQEQAYHHEKVHQESPLTQFDVPLPLCLQAVSSMPNVSDVINDTRALSPFPAFTAQQHHISSFTHEGQPAVSDYIRCKSYDNFQVNEAEQQLHYLHRNHVWSLTAGIQNSWVSTSMKLETSSDPLPLQRQNSLSSTDIGDKVSPPIFLASELSRTIDTFIEYLESGDSHPDASSACLKLSNHPYHNVHQGNEATTAVSTRLPLEVVEATQEASTNIINFLQI